MATIEVANQATAAADGPTGLGLPAIPETPLPIRAAMTPGSSSSASAPIPHRSVGGGGGGGGGAIATPTVHNGFNGNGGSAIEGSPAAMSDGAAVSPRINDNGGSSSIASPVLFDNDSVQNRFESQALAYVPRFGPHSGRTLPKLSLRTTDDGRPAIAALPGDCCSLPSPTRLQDGPKPAGN